LAGKKVPISDRVSDTAQSFRDTEIEYQLMAYLLRVNPLMCTILEMEWLSDTILQDIWSVINDLRIPMTKAMVIGELKDRGMTMDGDTGLYDDALDSLYSVKTKGFTDKSARHMVSQILKLSETRRVLIGCGKIIGSIRNFDLFQAQTELAELSRKKILVDSENVGSYLDGYEKRKQVIEDRSESDNEDPRIAGVPTGIYRFDRLIGGVLPKEFGVLAGVTGVGKTAGLINIGVNGWMNGYDTMIVSGEMSKELLDFRIDSYITRIPGLKFRTAQLSSEDYDQWDNMIKMYRTQHDCILYTVAYPRKYTAEDIKRDMTRVEEETGRKIKLICNDYINIMSPIGGKQGGWQDQADSVWDFKALVAENDLVGWTASQVIDDAYDKELYDASDIKYARAISECAPIIAALIRTDKDIIENRMKLQIIKMRNAPPPPRPIALTPKLDIMHIHEDYVEHKTLAGKKGGTIDMTRKTHKKRPKREIGGK
jgi:hypothetical protein